MSLCLKHFFFFGGGGILKSSNDSYTGIISFQFSGWVAKIFFKVLYTLVSRKHLALGIS